jgi:tRNA nucleotidyltransferase/poly(A) polymerase
MKRQLFLIIAGVFLSFNMLFAQNVSDVEATFRKGNASILLPQLSDEVDWIFATDNSTLSKSTFVTTLNQFFKNNPPKDFDIVHNGQRGDSKFLIGKYISSKETYRIHLLYKKNSNTYLITQVRIETTND